MQKGAKVILRNIASFQPGAVGLRLRNASPAVGRLKFPAFNLKQDRAHFELNEDGKGVDWPLADVIFLDPGPGIRVGEVLKADGPFCAVYFPDATDDQRAQDEAARWRASKLMKSGDLVVLTDDEIATAEDASTGGGSGYLPLVQADEMGLSAEPELLHVPGVVRGVGMSIDSLHAATSSDGDTGEPQHLYEHCFDGDDVETVREEDLPTHLQRLLDVNRIVAPPFCTFAFLFDTQGSLLPTPSAMHTNPLAYRWSDLPPLLRTSVAVDQSSAASAGLCMTVAVHVKSQSIVPLILSGQPKELQSSIAEKQSENLCWWAEHLDGARNILHVTVDAAAAACEVEASAAGTAGGQGRQQHPSKRARRLSARLSPKDPGSSTSSDSSSHLRCLQIILKALKEERIAGPDMRQNLISVLSGQVCSTQAARTHNPDSNAMLLYP